jgi:hypothetical protein
LGRSYRLNPPGDVGFVLGADVFEDGTILAKAPLVFRGGFSNGPNRRDEEYQTYSTDGELIDAVGLFQGPDQFIQTGGSGNQRYVSLWTPPFGRKPVLAVRADEFCFGAADSYEIECHAQDGSLATIIRRNVPPRPVTAADIAEYVDRQVAELLKVDDGGNLWVCEFDPEVDVGHSWTVFDHEGRMFGTVLLPSGLRATHIGDDFVLGIWRDELDVEHVRVHELRKQ